MTSDGALLSLIVNDEHALLVLAAWGGLECKLSQIDSDDAIEKIAAICGSNTRIVRAKLQTLLVARTLVDGGISEMADKLLQSRVQNSIGPKGKR